MNDEAMNVNPNFPPGEAVPPDGFPPVEPRNIHPGVTKPDHIEADASDLVNGLQDEVERLTKSLAAAEARLATSIAGELRALAGTVRDCQRRGHPHLGKHLEALLVMLGV